MEVVSSATVATVTDVNINTNETGWRADNASPTID